MKKKARVGWVLDTSPRRTFPLPWDKLSSVAQIRYAGIAKHLARTTPLVMERYRAWNRYEVVVFLKIMSDPAYRLAAKLKDRGTKIVFDANVNYYEASGDFIIPGTKPTAAQHLQARRMTQLADTVVADSSYLSDLCRAINPQTVFIPDAVNTEFFRPRRARDNRQAPLTLIWSGMGKKAHHLELIEKLLISLKDSVRLILVPSRPTSQDKPADVLDRLKDRAGASIQYWNLQKYRDLLGNADVIISPKDLGSSYELAHTEYKITLGMSMGLPALASPQRSYIEAIGDGLGGVICNTTDDWQRSLERFSHDRRFLREQGDLARKRVIERYAIPVIAKRYLKVFEDLL